MTGYVPTSAFSDEQGQAILTRLWELYGNLDVNPATKKKVRQGSYERRHAIAALQAELLEAAAHFERAREFHDWLYANTYDVISPYDPIAAEIGITNKLRDFERQLKQIEESYQGRVENLCQLVRDVIERLPPELAKETDTLVLDFIGNATREAGAS